MDVDAVRGATEWDMQVTWLDTDEIVPNMENPNEQDDRTFNALVRTVEKEGWTVPATVVFDEARQKYEIVGGEHRWRAAKILGSKLPCIVLPNDEWDRDRRDVNVVKDNLLRGKLNPEKFTALYNRMAQKYDAEVLQALMGFTTEDAFKRVYKEVQRNLPPGLQEALEGAREEIKNIDDLSLLLNRIFRDHGETLDSNMMTFTFGGKEVLWIRADKHLWTEVTALSKMVVDNHLDMAEVIGRELGGAADRLGERVRDGEEAAPTVEEPSSGG